jgi:hypothetical protein
MAGSNVKCLIPETGRLFWHLRIQKVSFQGHEEFSDMGECENDLWVAGKMSWYIYQQRDCKPLVTQFSGGKLKQKGFFHSAAGVVETPIATILAAPSWARRRRATVRRFGSHFLLTPEI